MAVWIAIVVLFISKNNLSQKSIDSVIQAAVPSVYNTKTINIYADFSEATHELHLGCNIWGFCGTLLGHYACGLVES